MGLPFRLSIRSSLYLVFTLVMISSLLVFAVTQVVTRKVEEEVLQVSERAVQMQQRVEQLRFIVVETQRLSLQGVLLVDQSQLFKAAGESIHFYRLLDEIVSLLNDEIAAHGEEEQQYFVRLIKRIEILRDRYEIYLQAVMSLSSDLVEGVVHESSDMQTISHLQKEFNKELDEIHHAILEMVAKEVEDVDEAYQVTYSVSYGGLFAMTVTVLLALIFISRYLSGPIQRLLQFVVRYGSEESPDQQRIHYDRRDEIGDLCRGINLMLDNIDRLTVSRNRLEDAHTRLKTASEAKSMFLSSMSHELRTPLNAVIGYAQLLETERDSLTEDEYQLFVSNIVNSGQHLLMLVDDVLDLEKIEGGHMQVKMDKVSLEYVISEALALTGTQAESAGITLINNVQVQQEHLVTADPGRLRQVLINLISNGIKYNRPGGSVTLECRRQGQSLWVIDVVDTGSGISEQDQASLFQPFERLGYRNSNVQGTGIGLVISRQLMLMMGGDIRVQSRPGEGSRFQVMIPAQANDLLTDYSPG